MIEFQISNFAFGLIVLVYCLGPIFACNALFQSRTPQGAMAWVIALICLPFISIPIFLFFGKKNIDGYELTEGLMAIKKKLGEETEDFIISEADSSLKRFLTQTEMHFLKGHKLKLLLNADETYDEMFEEIRAAKKFILLQMYIFRTDEIGKKFAEALKAKAREGVQVYVLYEKIGVHMSKHVLKDMETSGVNLCEFSPAGPRKWQLNFRNHRKLLIKDGIVGFLGGVNIGDDYLGRYPKIGNWRDTNVKVEGPVVAHSSITFLKDWHFSKNESPKVDLSPPVSAGDSNVLLLNSNPREERPINLLRHIQIFNSAEKRLWIANPYIIPPQGLYDSLLLAQMRGVDVRILIPGNSDNKWAALAMEVYEERFLKSGIRIFKYDKGMMHQKVCLLDSDLAIVGSTNFDFRSMHINFENSLVTDDPRFIKELEFSLRRDMEHSTELFISDLRDVPLHRKLGSRLVNSLAPIM